jgi:hypothetical protein
VPGTTARCGLGLQGAVVVCRVMNKSVALELPKGEIKKSRNQSVKVEAGALVYLADRCACCCCCRRVCCWIVQERWHGEGLIGPQAPAFYRLDRLAANHGGPYSVARRTFSPLPCL